MRVLACSVALIALLLTGGCASASSASTKPKSPPSVLAADSTATPTPGGLKIGGVTYDGSLLPTQAGPALTAAKHELPRIAGYWYGGEGSKPADFPGTLGGLLGELSCSLVPVYEYAGSPMSAPTLFSVIHPSRHAYLLALARNGAIVGSCDWMDPAGTGDWQSAHAYPAAFDLAGAQQALRAGLGTDTFMVRVLRVPRGYWVIGAAGDRELARFLAQDASFADDPSPNRLYTPGEVLKYGAPHGDGS